MVRQNKPAKQKTYRLSLVDNSTHRSLKSIRFTRTQAVIAATASPVLFVLLLYCLIAFTPLRKSIPGYPNEHSKKVAIENAIKIDSLENAMLRWNLYATNLSRVLSGEETVDFDSLMRQTGGVRYLSDKSEDELRRQDSLLRETVIGEERFGLSAAGHRILPIEGMHFFLPVKGVMAAGYDRADHPGVDIDSEAGALVSAVLDGSVIYSGNSEMLGQVIILQHDDNVVSIYANNSESLAAAGETVEAGTPIAVVGSRPGEPGRHYLHFELWHGGQPLDPSDYINF